MAELKTYVEKAKSSGLAKAEIIDTTNVVVGNWVRMKPPVFRALQMVSSVALITAVKHEAGVSETHFSV